MRNVKHTILTDQVICYCEFPVNAMNKALRFEL
jgi:hypothetical protein